MPTTAAVAHSTPPCRVAWLVAPGIYSEGLLAAEQVFLRIAQLLMTSSLLLMSRGWSVVRWRVGAGTRVTVAGAAAPGWAFTRRESTSMLTLPRLPGAIVARDPSDGHLARADADHVGPLHNLHLGTRARVAVACAAPSSGADSVRMRPVHGANCPDRRDCDVHCGDAEPVCERGRRPAPPDQPAEPRPRPAGYAAGKAGERARGAVAEYAAPH